MKYRLKVYSIWEYGQRKDSKGNPHQEDCTFPLPNDLKDSDRTFILCDGMGGHDAGEVASATVCEAMGNYILKDGHDSRGVFTDEDLRNAIDAAFAALDKKDSGAEKKMGTTMTFLKLHNNGATIAHMGDSRVYQIRPGETGDDTQILFETEDHSLVNDLIKIGELTKDEARTSKQKNVITRAMQPNMERKPKPDIKHITDIKAGDFFYMCSDGMLEQEDMANGESLKNIFSNAVSSVDEKLRILIGATKHNKDNHTALIIHIEGVEGEIAKSEMEKAAVPQYDMALVEGDDASEKTSVSEETLASVEAPTSGDKAAIKDPKDGSEDSSDENTRCLPAESKLHDRKIDKPKSKSVLSKMIKIGILAAIVVAACIVGINYMPSCSEKNILEKVEPTNKSQDKPRREIGGKQATRSQDHSQDESQNQGKVQEEEASGTASPEAVQTAVEEQQPVVSAVNGSASIQLPTQSDVVSSDSQKIQDSVKK